MPDVTQILARVESGDPEAVEQLLPLVYEELKKLAQAKMANERRDHTLQATALVHEAYIRLVGCASRKEFGPDAAVGQEIEPGTWRTREHFFRAAAMAMRHILIDSARRKVSQKRGGGQPRDLLIDVASPEAMSPADLLELNEALEHLAKAFPKHAKLIELQFFAGITQAEAAACLDISVQTARRYWLFARAWLFDHMAAKSPTNQ